MIYLQGEQLFSNWKGLRRLTIYEKSELNLLLFDGYSIQEYYGISVARPKLGVFKGWPNPGPLHFGLSLDRKF